MKSLQILAVLSISQLISGRFMIDNVNPWLVKMEYSVRGEVLQMAESLKARMQAGEKFPFEEIIACNIGNPQALGQKPLNFNREVISLVADPSKLEHECVGQLYSADAIARARYYLDHIPGGAGAYSHSQGLPIIRQEIANFLEARDGVSADPEDIFVTDGASAGVRACMQAMLTSSGKDAILVPYPQYPLYTALSALLNVKAIPYYLDEDDRWTMHNHELSRAADEAEAMGLNVKGLVVIAPGNPTGQCMSSTSMEDIINFSASRGIVLFADEVYQENIYMEGCTFESFKKVAGRMKSDALEMVSFHSVSKGFLGECGLRGGYFELYNIDADVKAEMYKLASVTLCSNTLGQIAVGLMVNPPKPDDEAFPVWHQQKDDILGSLKRRASKVTEALSKLEGVMCRPAEGALYAFPQITLPPKAVDAALAVGKQPDTFYCLALLEHTGIVTVPGSGFGQVSGTWHFRTTFLPPEQQVDKFIGLISDFHDGFMKKYAD